MSDDVRNMIVAARKSSASLPPTSSAPARMPENGHATGSRIPNSGHSPFGGYISEGSISGKYSDSQRSGWKPASAKAPVFKWSDRILKQHGSSFDRVVLAIRDAASRAVERGINPCVDSIYVTKVIREGWQLSPKDLSRGLKRLEDMGVILRREPAVRGKNARFILLPEKDPIS